MLFNTLILILKEKGLLDEEDVTEISDIFTLFSVLEGKSHQILNPEEHLYAHSVRSLINEKNWAGLKNVEPPPSLEVFHSRLIRSIPVLKKTSKIH